MMSAFIHGAVFVVCLALSLSTSFGVPGEKEQVCCFPKQMSGQLYNHVRMVHYHIAVDYKQSKAVLTNDGEQNAFHIVDIKKDKMYLFNGTECRQKHYQSEKLFPQCLSATPDKVHDLMITVPQGDVAVKAVNMQDGESTNIWFVYNAGEDTCVPLATTGTVSGWNMDEFYSHMKQGIPDKQRTLLDTDVSQCISNN